MFADEVRQAMIEQNVSQSELCKVTGIGKSSISQYLSGKVEPTAQRKKKILDALGLIKTDAPEKPPDMKPVERMSVQTAAHFLGVNHNTIRKGLRQGVFPWGYAVQTSENRWSYIINAKRFYETEGINT